MKLLDNKIVKIGELEFPVRITNRAMIEYENMTGSNISKLNGTMNIIQLFYCTAKAGAKSLGKEFIYTFEEFLDIIDNYYMDVITNFTKVLSDESGGDEKKQKAKH